MAFGRQRPLPDTEINLTSLIDILFIVLIFLVLTTTFARHTGIRISLPEAAQRHEESPSEAVEIQVDEAGQIYVRGNAVDIERLRAFLGEVENKERGVILRADRNARHGKVVEVLDAVRGAGFRRLAVEARTAG